MSNSGADDLCCATMGVGMKHALEKGLHALFLWLCVCVWFLFSQSAYLRCVCVYLKFLGVCVCFLLFCSTCLWLLLSKQSSASGELVAHSFSRCLVCGLTSILMFPVINTILPFSLSVSPPL